MRYNFILKCVLLDNRNPIYVTILNSRLCFVLIFFIHFLRTIFLLTLSTSQRKIIVYLVQEGF